MNASSTGSRPAAGMPYEGYGDQTEHASDDSDLPAGGNSGPATPHDDLLTSIAASLNSQSGTNAIPTPTNLSDLMALDDDQFMQVIASGKLPDDVTSSSSAMLQVQARLNQVTQTDQLMTQMMEAMHQMKMNIISNVRV